MARTPVAQWPRQDRPLGKLHAGGPATMSNAELLALLIPSGTRDPKTGELLTRLDLARSLIADRGSLEAVLTASPYALATHPGIGRAIAGAIRSAGILTGRLEAEQAGKERLQVGTPEDVAKAFGPQLRDLKQEVFMTIFLNSANVVESTKVISTGGLSACIVEPRAIFREVALREPSSLLFCHNHPSGNCEPSRQDVKITKQLVEAGKLLGTPVQDHVIIGGRGYTSLAERGVIS